MNKRLTDTQTTKLHKELNKKPRATQEVIAKRAGVSKATVARHAQKLDGGGGATEKRRATHDARDADGTRLPMRTTVERKNLGGGRARITVRVNDVSIEASSPAELKQKLDEVFGPIRAALEAATRA